jgi:hypothetical protein
MIDIYGPYIGLALLTIFGGFLCYLSYRGEQDEPEKKQHDYMISKKSAPYRNSSSNCKD